MGRTNSDGELLNSKWIEREVSYFARYVAFITRHNHIFERRGFISRRSDRDGVSAFPFTRADVFRLGQEHSNFFIVAVGDRHASVVDRRAIWVCYGA